eukprot:scaffold1505_cov256-Pinguiococcus_pyrenoidosus.AAC.23
MTDYENVDDDGNPDPNGSVRNTIIYYSEFVFLGVSDAAEVSHGHWTTEAFHAQIYSLEFLVKIVAFGFAYGADSVYLRDPWNVLDFVTVFASFLALDESLPNLSAVRTFRAFRFV